MSTDSYYFKNLDSIGVTLYDVDLFKTDDKHDGKYKLCTGHILYMLSRTQSMFTYNNLPDTIPQRELEKMLQINGNVFFTTYDSNYYVFTGGLGGEPDVYYERTKYTVANPALNMSEVFDIKNDGVLIRNDSYMIGLLPMFQKYALLQTENDITMRIADINSRIPFFISAQDDRTDKSARVFLEHIVNGEMGVISDSPFFEGLKVNNTGNTTATRLTDLIEYQQYIKAAWFNELGINANYNMKRETLNSAESQLNDDALLPFVDDMLRCRTEAIEDINNKYNLEISVSLNSSWLKEFNKQMIQVEDNIPEETADNIPEDTADNIPEEGDNNDNIPSE